MSGYLHESAKETPSTITTPCPRLGSNPITVCCRHLLVDSERRNMVDLNWHQLEGASANLLRAQIHSDATGTASEVYLPLLSVEMWEEGGSASLHEDRTKDIYRKAAAGIYKVG